MGSAWGKQAEEGCRRGFGKVQLKSAGWQTRQEARFSGEESRMGFGQSDVWRTRVCLLRRMDGVRVQRLMGGQRIGFGGFAWTLTSWVEGTDKNEEPKIGKGQEEYREN